MDKPDDKKVELLKKLRALAEGALEARKKEHSEN